MDLDHMTTSRPGRTQYLSIADVPAADPNDFPDDPWLPALKEWRDVADILGHQIRVGRRLPKGNLRLVLTECREQLLNLDRCGVRGLELRSSGEPALRLRRLLLSLEGVLEQALESRGDGGSSSQQAINAPAEADARQAGVLFFPGVELCHLELSKRSPCIDTPSLAGSLGVCAQISGVALVEGSGQPMATNRRRRTGG